LLAGKVLIRVDGSATIGLGHIVRCMALADILRPEFDIQFVCKDISEKLALELQKEQLPLVKINANSDLFNLISVNDIVVIDGYDFDVSFQLKIKSFGCKLVCIDDTHHQEYAADLIINHGPSLNKDLYKASKYTRFALGHDYLLLRKAFLDQIPVKREIVSVNNLLVILGGSDIKSLSSHLIDHKIYQHFDTINIVSGASDNSYPQLRSYCEFIPNINLFNNLTDYQLVKLSSKCEICICTASGVSYEMACIGIGMVVCMVSQNQEHFYNFFIENQLASGVRYQNLKDIGKVVDAALSLKNSHSIVSNQIKNQKATFKNDSRGLIKEAFKMIK
jgi:UDP-2,4-diacetamido-2,4,6-trideoxy-beta-L-altropyranose hydrolase